MFDKIIKPMILFGYEMQGFHNANLFKEHQLNFADRWIESFFFQVNRARECKHIEFQIHNTKLYGIQGIINVN